MEVTITETKPSSRTNLPSLERHYVNGEFVTPFGTDYAELYSPATGEAIGRLRLGNEADAKRAIAAAKAAFAAMSRTSVEQRIDMLQRMHDAVNAHLDDLREAVFDEYGSPASQMMWHTGWAPNAPVDAIRTLKDFDFDRRIGSARIRMTPFGVVGIITPWNANAGFIVNKLAMTIASGATAVIKPSELSGLQTDVVMRALAEADLPKGVFNIVNGTGPVVGEVLTTHQDIAKISFTGSTDVGRRILKSAADTFKRVTLELGGKSPFVVLEDADFDASMPFMLASGFNNSGQSCELASRFLVPRTRLGEFESAISIAVSKMKVGDPRKEETQIGPVVSEKQWNRVQSYIRLGTQEGAKILVGGEGLPEGVNRGWYVKPTVFTNGTNDMQLAREEVFGPVLLIIPYDTEDEAIRMANDSNYGLNAYVVSRDDDKALKIASRLEAGKIVVNGAEVESLSPFGGFKQSGMGRENGPFGLEEFVEPKSIAI